MEQLTFLVLAGLIFWIPHFIRLIRLRKNHDEYNKLVLQLFLLLSVLAWLFVVSPTPEKRFEYLIPVIPFVVVMSSTGLVEGYRYLLSILSQDDPQSNARVLFCYLGALIFLQLFVTIYCAPNYVSYFNWFSSHSKRPATALPALGYQEAAKFLHLQSEKDAQPVLVKVIGSRELLAFSYRRNTPSSKANPVRFYDFDDNSNGYYTFVAYPNLQQNSGRFQEIFKAAPVFSYQQRGIELIRVYAPQLPTAEKPLTYLPKDLQSLTGKLADNGQHVVSISSDKPGYALYGGFALLEPGSYQLDVRLGRSNDGQNAAEEDKDIFKIYLGNSCKRVVRSSQLSSTELSSIRFKCNLKSRTQAQLVVEWPGEVSGRVGEISLGLAE